jgi:hypothetical protein
MTKKRKRKRIRTQIASTILAWLRIMCCIVTLEIGKDVVLILLYTDLLGNFAEGVNWGNV